MYVCMYVCMYVQLLMHVHDMYMQLKRPNTYIASKLAKQVRRYYLKLNETKELMRKYRKREAIGVTDK